MIYWSSYKSTRMCSNFRDRVTLLFLFYYYRRVYQFPFCKEDAPRVTLTPLLISLKDIACKIQCAELHSTPSPCTEGCCLTTTAIQTSNGGGYFWTSEECHHPAYNPNMQISTTDVPWGYL